MKVLKSILALIALIFISLYFGACSRMNGLPRSIVLEPLGEEALLNPDLDSVTLIATNRYKTGIIKPLFQGSNYRKAWQTPITVPVLYLNSYEGGLTPIEKGGGLQTLSMDLQGQNDVVYTLRSVNKNPEDAVPDFAKKMKIDDIVMDAMSAQHPYGAIVVAELADAIDLQHTHPRLVFLPTQEQLDSFNQEFQNRMFLLEYEPEGSGQWLGLDNVEKIIDTEDVQKMLLEYPDSKINVKELLKARLFDLLIGDWDRHSKQWGWLVIKNEEENNYTYAPLPTDRDNAFYNPGGLIPWIITRPSITPFLRPFKKKIDYMPGMITGFDSFFLLDVPEDTFVEVALELQISLTDEEIENAFNVWPKQFYNIDAKKMIKKIKARKKKLPTYAKQLKKAIDDRGQITTPLKGSDELYLEEPKIKNEKTVKVSRDTQSK